MTIQEFESEEEAAEFGKLLNEEGFNELTTWWDKLEKQQELIDVARKSYLQTTGKLKIIKGGT